MLALQEIYKKAVEMRWNICVNISDCKFADMSMYQGLNFTELIARH